MPFGAWGARIQRFVGRWAGISILASAICASASAQIKPNSPQPDNVEEGTGQGSTAIQSPSEISRQPVPLPVHRFWDKQNDWLFAGIGVVRGLDFASTKNFRARGRQEILLNNSIVDNNAFFAGIEAATAGASIGLSYWLHRQGHHKAERWVSYVHIGVTSFGVIRNYSLKSVEPHIRGASPSPN